MDDNAVYQQWQSLTSPVTTMTFGVQRTPTYLSAISADKTGALKVCNQVLLHRALCANRSGRRR